MWMELDVRKLHVGRHARGKIEFAQMLDNFLVDWIIGRVCVCAVARNCFVRRRVSVRMHYGNWICY